MQSKNTDKGIVQWQRKERTSHTLKISPGEDVQLNNCARPTGCYHYFLEQEICSISRGSEQHKNLK